MYNIKSHEETENKVLANLLRKPLESKSIHKIAVDARLSYVTAHKVIPELLKRKIVRQEKKGKAKLISIDFENSALEKLSTASLYGKCIFFKKHPFISMFSKELEEVLAGKFYILLLFGSYAKENFRKESDIDLLFIIPERKDIEWYKAKVDIAARLHPALKINYGVVSSDDFMDMLDEKYTVGRSAFQHGIVLFGAEQYYAMVKKYAGTKGY